MDTDYTSNPTLVPWFCLFPTKTISKEQLCKYMPPGRGGMCRTIFMYLDFNQKGQWKCDGGFMKPAASSEAYEDFLCDHVCWNVPQRCVGQSVVPGLQHLHRVKKDRISPNPYRVTQQLQTIRTAQPHWSSSNLKAAADQRCVCAFWMAWLDFCLQRSTTRTHTQSSMICSPNMARMSVSPLVAVLPLAAKRCSQRCCFLALERL